MKPDNLKSLVTALFVVCLVCVSSAGAENAYRWVDAHGRTTYGSKPPANAKNVETLNPKSYSKYSSTKLLKGYGRSGSAATQTSTGSASRG